MVEQFFMWWFEEHYIWSTLLTPFLVMVWTIFKGEFLWRGFIACILWLFGAVLDGVARALHNN